MKILVVDVGGTHVKLASSHHRERREFTSGPRLTPKQMMEGIRKAASDWTYQVVSMGYPGVVLHGRIAREPHNLGSGWPAFDFRRAFGKPIKIVNDAAMQALGSYRGRSMLFLGLGTGLGSAMIVDGVLLPMELAHLPYRKERTYEEYLGILGLKRLGRKKWRRHVWDVVERLRSALEVDYVVLGGGNARLLKKCPKGVYLGNNRHSVVGGLRLWRPTSGHPE